MSRPYIKARASETEGNIIYEMDRETHEQFSRLIKRAVPTKQDSPVVFRQIKDRIEGVFLGGAAIMGWLKR